MINVISILLLCFGLSFFILFLYSLNKKRNSLAIPFTFLCLAIAIYITGYALELQAHTPEQFMFFLTMEFFGAPFMSEFWLLFAYKFRHRQSAPLHIALLFMIIPFLTLFLGVTNDIHHLLYTSIDFISYKGSLLPILEKGLSFRRFAPKSRSYPLRTLCFRYILLYRNLPLRFS
ncbi:MAG: diguanylate cyclase [Bacillota bacterium]|nr:diguanylate cyclase [Bacillota bacterium]